MQLLFEARPDIINIDGKMVWFQTKPTIHPEPVLTGSNDGDAMGCSIYGSVLEDGGKYRMWYQAWPRDWNFRDSALVGYAESDDGIDWRKPTLNIVDHGNGPNNLCNLGMHAPSVYIDPQAAPSHRYRAVGCTNAEAQGAIAGAGIKGYYTAHSADGLNWTLDSNEPIWPWADVSTSIYHPQRQCAIAAVKRAIYVGGFMRRSFWTAEQHNGVWTTPASTFIPDEFDDTLAIGRGYRSADYYGMGMMPAAQANVAFIWMFRHRLPFRHPGCALFGDIDVTLAYQHEAGDRWLHATGRRDFISHEDVPFESTCIYTAANVTEVGDQQRLYFCGTNHSHGWHLDTNWQKIDKRAEQFRNEGISRIGFAHWPKWRLFGYQADPDGSICIDIGELKHPVKVSLNYDTHATGGIRAEVMGYKRYDREDQPGRGLAESIALTGDSLSTEVAWQDGSVIKPMQGRCVAIRFHLERARVYAFDVKPA